MKVASSASGPACALWVPLSKGPGGCFAASSRSREMTAAPSGPRSRRCPASWIQGASGVYYTCIGEV